MFHSPPSSTTRVLTVCSHGDVGWTIQHALRTAGLTVEVFGSVDLAWLAFRSSQKASTVWIVEARQVGVLLALLMDLEPQRSRHVEGVIFLSAHSEGAGISLEFQEATRVHGGLRIRALSLPFSAPQLVEAVTAFLPSRKTPSTAPVVPLLALLPSRIVSAARATLGVSCEEVSAALSHQQVRFSAQELAAFERSGRASRTVGAVVWNALREVLALPPEVLEEGYLASAHLTQVQAAVVNQRFLFPVYPDLRRLMATQAESVSSTNPCSGNTLRMDVK